jgi:hypothetical protein
MPVASAGLQISPNGFILHEQAHEALMSRTSM